MEIKREYYLEQIRIRENNGMMILSKNLLIFIASYDILLFIGIYRKGVEYSV